MLCNYSAVPDTPEMERIKSTQKNISSVFYKNEVGAGTAVKETPEIERVKKNQHNISSCSCCFRNPKQCMLVNTLEQKPIKRNTKCISGLIKYKEEIQHATTISDPPELRRVKENQKNISNVCPIFTACTLLSGVLNMFVPQ
uniref:Nebulette n=1 Tax=Otus sunia TaxID=257818 RepID=A0A8C8BIU8_9STRI